jgi:hypothetical protein
MRWNRIKKVIAGAVIAVAVALGSLATTATTASAQRRGYPHRVIIVRRPPFFPYAYGFYPYGAYPYYYSDPIAYQKETGYSDGMSRGKSDAKKGLAASPESHKHFSKSSSMAYRDAFEQGYNDGYNSQRRG